MLASLECAPVLRLNYGLIMAQPQIFVENLEKRFRVAEREAGLWGAFKGLARRRYRDVQALHSVASQSNPASWWVTSDFGGYMEASIALTRQVCGRIDEIRPVADIISEIRTEFFATIESMSGQYLG